MCANFQLKRTTLTFLVQICPKRKLGFEIQKTNAGIRISILEIPCVPILDKTDNFEFWTQIIPKRKLEFEIQKTNAGIRISILEIPCVPSFRQNRQLWILVPNLPKNGFSGRNFKNLSLDSESVTPIYHKPFLLDKFRKYNIKQTPKISNLVVSKYKTNKDLIKIVVYTVSSFNKSMILFHHFQLK